MTPSHEVDAAVIVNVLPRPGVVMVMTRHCLADQDERHGYDERKCYNLDHGCLLPFARDERCQLEPFLYPGIYTLRRQVSRLCGVDCEWVQNDTVRTSQFLVLPTRRARPGLRVSRRNAGSPCSDPQSFSVTEPMRKALCRA